MPGQPGSDYDGPETPHFDREPNVPALQLSTSMHVLLGAVFVCYSMSQF